MAHSLANAAPHLATDVVELVENGSAHEVFATIRQDSLEDYVRAAERLNESRPDVVSLQHEFGIFGGRAGDHLLKFLAHLRAPVVTTLHTALERPDSDQRRVMDALARRSSRLVVMAERGREILERVYGVDRERIAVIPHGAPDLAFSSPASAKARLGLGDRRVLMTFGLLSPNKGLETVIRAMPEIAEAAPDALYLIVGATHPALIRRNGEAYRQSLAALARELGVESHVRFVDAYLDQDALLEHLCAADIYVTPYLNEAQVTSGTLAYAVALGKPVVSTPFWHARELLANDVGILVDFNRPDGFAAAISELLIDDRLRQSYRKKTYAAGRGTIWANSAESYLAIFAGAAEAAPAVEPKPRPDLAAVLRMTDDCGILQHAAYRVPDRTHGYCIDDNARALTLVQKLRAIGRSDPRLDRLELLYAAFVNHAWNEETGRFRNFMGYDRAWREASGSDDSNGRAFVSLAETAAGAADRELRAWALDLAGRTEHQLSGMKSPRACAFLVIGSEKLLDASQAAGRRTILESGAAMLTAALDREARKDWIWFEPVLGYDNACLPHALLVAGKRLGDREMIAAGLRALRWLAAAQTSPLGCFQPVGNATFGQPYKSPSSYDQQPLEAASTIAACAAANAATGDDFWIEEARRAFGWFFGRNDHLLPLADESGGCFDGLTPEGVNRNQGAESILSLQLSHCEMKLLERSARRSTGGLIATPAALRPST